MKYIDESAAFDIPFLLLGNPTNAWPTVLLNA
jgi:hypothetical protein